MASFTKHASTMKQVSLTLPRPVCVLVSHVCVLVSHVCACLFHKSVYVCVCVCVCVCEYLVAVSFDVEFVCC